MRRHFRLPMAVVASALLGLIALLATLQYRWLGQISGAERDRMKATLNTRAAAFAQDVDRELTRAYLLFQLDAMPQDQGPLAGITARYDRWQATARFPRMIKDVYLVTAEGDAGWKPLQRFNPSARVLEPADWPSSFAGVRKAIEQTPLPAPHPPAQGNTSFVIRPGVPPVWASVPALVVAAPMLIVSHVDARENPRPVPVQMSAGLRYTIVQLDAEYIRAEMLPALAQQHFQGTGDGFDYQLAVVPASGGGAPLYHSVREFAPAADASVDARVDFFQVRVKDFDQLVGEVARFATFTSTPRDARGERVQTIVRQTITAPRTGASIPPEPLSIVLEGSGAAMTGQRLGAVLTGAAASFGSRAGAATPGQWRLLVKHPSGSLERAVDAVRRRNMVVSSSVLGILGVSVGFLVISTRRAHDLARQQLEFVATVSHELRTPLAVIRSAADNLADGVVHDEAHIRQYGHLVRREGLRLTDLVEQILEYAGLQSGQRTMAAKPVDLGSLLRDVSSTAETTAPAGMTVELVIPDDLPPVSGDESALRRVFQNLVGNAVKYGAAAGWVGIRASSGGGSVEVGVSDKGIGIAPADHARIFDPFYRAPDVVAAQFQGAGLGLSLVKRIVEAHAGRISVTSTPGRGSTFIVTLPALQGHAVEGHDGVGQTAPQPS